MRRLMVAIAMVAVLSGSSSAQAAAGGGVTTTTHPMSIGLGIGFQVLDMGGQSNAVAFLLSLPFEYTFKAGPGELALRLTFSVAPKKIDTGGFGFFGGGTSSTIVGIGLPLGVSYKLRPIAAYPFYVWPFLDIGPSFTVYKGDATAGGIVQVGAGLSYMVHPYVELWFRPVGLGAGFSSAGGSFMYTFLIGTSFHFL